MSVSIKNVYLTLNVMGKVKDESKATKPQVETIRENGYYSKFKAPDGVYIVNDTGDVIAPEFWGLYRDKHTPIGVAVIDKENRILINMNESEKELRLLNDTESYGKEFDTIEKAKLDLNGENNTKSLLEKNSEAAIYCNNIGKGWHLPSLGEMMLANKYRELIDAALVMINGEPFKCAWYWTSTQCDSGSAWLLRWSDGGVGDNYEGSSGRVRAFAAF